MGGVAHRRTIKPVTKRYMAIHALGVCRGQRHGLTAMRSNLMSHPARPGRQRGSQDAAAVRRCCWRGVRAMPASSRRGAGLDLNDDKQIAFTRQDVDLA